MILIFGGASRLAKRIADVRKRLTVTEELIHVDLVERDEADVRNIGELLRAIDRYRPDVVVNCAAATDVNRCESVPDHALSVNALGAANVAMACRLSGVQLIHISTDYVFSGMNGPVGDDGIPYPVNAYGLSKLLGESAVRSIMPFGSIIMRVGWLYGIEYKRSQPMLAMVEGGLRVNGEGQKAYTWDTMRGTPTHVGSLPPLVMWAFVRSSPLVPTRTVHVGPREDPVTWFEFLVKDFNVRPMRENRPLMARRPENGGLKPSEGWETPGYAVELQHFKDEFQERYGEAEDTEAGAGT